MTRQRRRQMSACVSVRDCATPLVRANSSVGQYRGPMAPLPKKKHTRARKGGRAAHHAISLPTLVSCACSRGLRIPPHRPCPECGHHKGRTVKGNWPQENLIAPSGAAA